MRALLILKHTDNSPDFRPVDRRPHLRAGNRRGALRGGAQAHRGRWSALPYVQDRPARRGQVAQAARRGGLTRVTRLCAGERLRGDGRDACYVSARPKPGVGVMFVSFGQFVTTV